MDLFEMLRSLLVASSPRAPLQLNQPDLDPVDPATGKLLPGGVVAPPAPAPAGPANGGTTRPLNAQEALQQGDPRLIEFMRQRQVGGVRPTPPPPPETGFGAKPRITSFGDGT